MIFGNKPFRVLLLVLALAWGFISARAWGAMNEGEHHYLLGYQAYLDKNYGECADENYKVVEAGIGPVTKAKFYLAFCQVKLGLLQLAAYNIQDVDPHDFNPQEKQLYIKLKEKLEPYIADLSRIYFTLYPYGGGISFAPGYSRKSGSFFGLYSDIFAQSWKFTVGIERLSFVLTPPFSSFVQFQTLLGIQKTFGDLEAHARGIYIHGDIPSQDGIFIYGFGLSSYLGQERAGRIYVDGYYSSYPNSTLLPLSVFQLNLAIERAIVRSEDFEVSIKVGSQTIYATSPLTIDTATGFVRSSFYERGSGELNFKASKVLWGASIGFGTEAFGVRNDGAVVYSGFEEHQLGIGGYAGYTLSDTLSIRGTYQHEQFVVGKFPYSADTIFGMVTFTF